MMKMTVLKDGTIGLSDFNAIQAYKIARKLEKDGIAFYTKAKNETDNEEIKNALGYLLTSEEDHLSFFEKKMADAADDDDDLFENDDVVDFLNSNVFAEGIMEKARDASSETIQILSVGINAEKKSIAFYQALLSHTTDPKAKKALADIIDEEKKHLSTLSQFIS